MPFKISARSSDVAFLSEFHREENNKRYFCVLIITVD